MKTLFFVLACFLSGLIPSFADDDIPWHVTDRRDIAGSTAPHITPTLENLKKALKIGTSLASVVTQCGLPDAEYDPKKWPSPNRGYMMSGGIFYHNGELVGEEEYLRFRYDLPGQGQVCISTAKDQHVQYAFFYATKGESRYLVGKPVVTRINLNSVNTAK